MTLNEVIDLIQEWIVTNGNEEITADVLRPILEAMVNQPNDLIGDLDDLTTTNKDNLVEAINEVRTLAITNAGLVIHSGSGTPIETPPVSVGVGDFYAQVIFPSTSVVSFWQYNGSVWVEQRPQRTRTILHFVSLVGVTIGTKSQVQWMAEAINLNISNGAVYECDPGDIIDFYVNLLEDPNNDTPLLKRVFTRLITGETSVTSVDEFDLMPDGSEDVPIDSELIIELGDIGTDNVWDAFNTDPNQPFDMDNEMFVSAIQNGDNKLWQWIGGTGLFGSTETLAVEADFLDLTEQPPITTYQLFRKYDDIAAMLADQSTQIAQQGILVLDASADPNITFPVGLDAEKKYAYYQKKAGSTTGTISDYRLISAPYGNHTASIGLTTDELAAINGANAPSASNVFATMADAGSGSYISAIVSENTTFTLSLTHKDKLVRVDGYASIIVDSGLSAGYRTIIKKTNDATISLTASEDVVLEVPDDKIAEIFGKYNAIELVLEKIDSGTEYWGVYGSLVDKVDSLLGFDFALSIDNVTPTKMAWLKVYKSSDYPLITTTKDYFCLYSSDHDTGAGGIYWGQFDDPELNGFEEMGLIISGYQAEYPYLITIPTSESGLSTDTIFLYYHTNASDPDNAGLQQTHLITTNGGALHTATWTQRGKVLGIVGDENHTGYLKVYKRGVGDYVGHHLFKGGSVGGVDNQYKVSTSPDGLTWTRQYIVDTNDIEPTGYYGRSSIQYIEGENKGVIYYITGSEQYFSITETDTDRVPTDHVRNLVDVTGSDLKMGGLYIENGVAYLYVRNIDNNNWYIRKFILAEIL